MFNRIELKTTAKKQLQENWKIPLLTTLIVIIIEFIFTIPSLVKTMNAEAINVTAQIIEGSGFTYNLQD
ncbi:MAG TPA: hypothetical protein VFC68_00985, partial [Treponemataceae bacterium]|nr:hypothetical protein [Treponemataceae bacterium]